MLAINKYRLSIPLAALSAALLAPMAGNAATAGDISQSQVLNTSPLWADAQSYHSCNVVNVSSAALSISFEIIESSGTVLVTTGATPISLAAGASAEILSSPGSYVGFARCRFTLTVSPVAIRANETVFHPLGGALYQTYAMSEAR